MVAGEKRMGHPTLIGKRIYLRDLGEADLGGPWFDWMNDQEVTRFLESGRISNSPEAMRSYFQNVVQNPDNVMLAIVETATDKHIGNIKMGPINRTHRFANLAIMIGDKDYWGKGYGREAWDLMVTYGFETLDLHKITLGVYADHPSAVNLYKKVGFKIEGTLRKQLYRDGTYHDKYVMGMLREEYSEVRKGKGLPSTEDDS